MTETITSVQGGWSANVLELQLAKAAREALKAGKDPMSAAQERLTEMDLPAAPEATEEPEPLEAKFDRRRYLLAVCRLGSGQFEHLSDADLMDVSALVKLSFHSPEQWLDVRENM